MGVSLVMIGGSVAKGQAIGFPAGHFRNTYPGVSWTDAIGVQCEGYFATSTCWYGGCGG